MVVVQYTHGQVYHLDWRSDTFLTGDLSLNLCYAVFSTLTTRKSSSDLYEEAIFQKHTCLSDTMTGRDL